MKKGIKIFHLILLLILIPSILFSRKFYEPEFIDKPINIDGKLNEEVWEDAKEIKEFIQIYPKPNHPMSHKAYVKILYDENNLYFGFLVYDDFIISTALTRDKGVGDFEDFVGVIIDPRMDGRSGYSFSVNLLGTQSDDIIDKDGEEVSGSWDAIWFFAVSKFKNGYSLEICIPFKILSFEIKDENNFGLIIHIGDSLSPNQWELSAWSNEALTIENPFRISSAGILKGLRGIRRRTLGLEFVPYNTLFFDRREDKISKWRLGIDIKSNFSSNLSAEATLNPDYSQIEADVDQFNIEKKSLLYYPEKRLFFLEQMELWETPINLFYTRIIKDIDGGAKLNWRRTSFDTLLLYTHSNSIYSEKFSDLIAGRFRWKFKNTYLGFTGLLHNQNNLLSKILSLDMNNFIGEKWQLKSQFAKSWLNDFSKDSNAFSIEFSKLHTNPKIDFGFELGYKRIPESFHSPYSYFPYEKDLQTKWANLIFFFLPSKYIKRVTFDTSYERYNTVSSGILFKEDYGFSGGVTLTHGFFFSSSLNFEKRLYENNYYNNKLAGVGFGYGIERKDVRVFLNYIFGDYYGSKLDYYILNTELSIFSNLALNLRYEREGISNNSNKEVKNLFVLLSNWRIIPKLFFKTFIQRSDITDSTDINLLLQYEFSAGRNFFLVWNKGRDYSGRKKEVTFIKIAYGFSF